MVTGKFLTSFPRQVHSRTLTSRGDRVGFAEILFILLRLQRPRGDLEITLLCRITYFF